jgi:glycogen operon protein
VVRLRQRAARNLLTVLMVSQGVPMILGGDEMLRSQGGNNNAYCQDNATSWIDWTLLEKNRGFAEFCRKLIALRRIRTNKHVVRHGHRTKYSVVRIQKIEA